MANSDLEVGALSKVLDYGRQQRRAARRQATIDRAIYALVTTRDGYRCRACHVYCGVMGHRHHLRGRQFTTVHDVCVICEGCHSLLHVRVGGKRLKLYGDANQRNEHGALNGLTLETRQIDGTWSVENGL